ncbi:MAG: SDR family oxidoreductase [Bacteroidales bacterium]|nr:SDR family oxidoreductase [Bacteroidales bacterium]
MDWYSQESFCKGLPSIPKPEIGVILVTGATGYIGGRLVPELIGRGYNVRVMVRSYSPEYEERWPDAEIMVADALKVSELKMALKGVSVAYYLIHSLLLGKKAFEQSDLQAVTNFRFTAEEQKLQRIIYLGALGNVNTNLSNHLRSRINVAKILEQGKVPTTILQAAIIIGSGSASFEILENIVRNTPIIINPPWANTLCQPISIRDVIKYLTGVLENSETTGKTYDIGGSDVLSYKDMMKIFARLLRKNRLYIPSPFSGIKGYSYIISLITPVPAPVISCLMEGVKNEVVVKEYEIGKYIDFQPIRFKVALLRALSREEHDKIATRWSDAYPPAHELAMKLIELSDPPRYISKYSLKTDKDSGALFRSVCQIGGKNGWFHTNWMWRLRGMIDRVFMGVGTSRGRRSVTSLRVNDVIDFWRVEELIQDKKLLLRAEMKIPGKAWLEFNIENEDQQNRLWVIAYFQPEGVPGYLYWYNFLPFHFFIFKDLLKQLCKRS